MLYIQRTPPPDPILTHTKPQSKALNHRRLESSNMTETEKDDQMSLITLRHMDPLS